MNRLVIKNESGNEPVIDESSRVSRIAVRGMLIVLALILSYLESFIPTYIILPGVRLGLANIVIVYVLYRYGLKDAFAVGVSRIIISALLFGNVLTLIYSMAGMLLSIPGMYAVKKIRASLPVVSITGAVLHNLGQCIVAAAFLKSVHLFYYFGFVILCGIVTGLIVGMAARGMLGRAGRLLDREIAAPELKLTSDELIFNQGESVAIIGENGSGKSTLALHIAGLKKAPSLSALYNGENVYGMESFSGICGLVKQQPSDGVLFSSLARDIRFGFDNLGLDEKERERRLNKIGAFTGGLDMEEEYRRMSGGELSRAAFLSIYLQLPDILILDEPLPMLDPAERLTILRSLIGEYKDAGRILFIITHEAAAAELCDRALSVSGGVISENDDHAPYIKKPEGESTYDAPALSSEPIVEAGELRIYRAYDLTAAHDISAAGDASPAVDISAVRDAAPAVDPSAAGDILICAMDLSFSYKSGKKICERLNAYLAAGGFYILKGPSGAGKTTLLRLLAGLLKPDSGSIISKESVSIGYTDQFSDNQFFAENVLDEVLAGFNAEERKNSGLKEMAESELRSWGLGDEFFGRDPYTLSEGEKRRLSFAIMFVRRPRVIIMDEPFSGLDSKWGAAAKSRLIKEASEGAAVIISDSQLIL